MKKMLQKSLFKIILFVIMVGLISGLPQSVVFAVTETQELAVVTSPCDILVQLIYDGEKPERVVFVSPSGARYEEGVSPESQLKFYQGNEWINYKIINAEAGTWQIEYEKGNSRNAKFSVSLSTQNLSINSFSVNKVENSRAEVSFETLYDGSGISYNYEIYAVAGIEMEEGYKLLEQGTAKTDSVVTRDVNLSSLASYDAYRLRLDVYADNGVFEIFDSADSGEFSYTNPNAAEAPDGVDISVDTANMKVAVNWAQYSGSNLFISAFADEGTEPIFYQNLENWESDEVYFDYLESHSKLKVNVYKRENGVLSAPLTKEFSVKELAVSVDAGDATNQAQIKVSYDIAEPTEATVVLNEANQLVRLDGQGSFALTLAEGGNELSITYMDGGVEYIISKTVFLDKMPPHLELYEDLDKKKVNKVDLIITGNTEAAATISINGQNVEVDESGEFSHSMQLQHGDNIIEIKATDVAGNTALRSILVVCEAKGGKGIFGFASGVSYLPLVITIAISAVLVALAFIFMKKRQYAKIYRKDLPFSVNMLNISSYASVILAVVMAMVVAFAAIEFARISQIVNDISFIDIAEKSVGTAYGYITKKNICFWTMIAGTVLAIAFLVASFILKKKYKEKVNN